MALYGQIKEFNQTEETIHDYLDRLCFYLEANEVTVDAKKRAVIGPQQFRLLKELSAPAKPADKSFNELTKLLKDHHAPAPPKFMCRAKFDARSRHQGETIANYVAALRHLSEYCEFGDTLNDRLCEKFATGVNNQDIGLQRKLLERNLTLDKAIQLATSIQQSSDAAKSLAPPTKNAIERTPKRKFKFRPAAKPSASTSTTRCHRCNGPHTSAGSCPLS